MPEHQITIKWQFDPAEEDSNHLTLNNIAERPSTDDFRKSPSENIVRSNQKISRNNLSECLQKNGKVDISVVEAYLDILCAYHNKRHPTPSNTLPKYINLGHIFFDKLSQRPSSGNPHQGLSWGTARLSEFAPNLDKIDLRTSLLDVEHLLVPVMPRFELNRRLEFTEFTDLNHVTLLIISPRIKLIEFFDSRFENGDKWIYLMLEYLTYELGCDFKRNEWSYRQNQCPAQQLAIVYNPDEATPQPIINFYGGNDGPIHAMIHAWNCLFGFSSHGPNRSIFNVHEDIVKKRHRIVVDICANRIILEDKFDFENNENLVPTVIDNYYLGVTQNKWGDWVPQRPLGQSSWSSDHPELPHLSLAEKVTSLQYYTWAVSYGRPRCGRTPEEEGRNKDGSLKYPLIIGTMQDSDRRRELLLEICKFLEIDGREEKYEEKEGWTEKVLMRAISAYIDEKIDGFRDSSCDTELPEGETVEKRRAGIEGNFWATLTSRFRTVKYT